MGKPVSHTAYCCITKLLHSRVYAVRQLQVVCQLFAQGCFILRVERLGFSHGSQVIDRPAGRHFVLSPFANRLRKTHPSIIIDNGSAAGKTKTLGNPAGRQIVAYIHQYFIRLSQIDIGHLFRDAERLCLSEIVLRLIRLGDKIVHALSRTKAGFFLFFFEEFISGQLYICFFFGAKLFQGLPISI
ncbi:MAG: hypothetical protein BWY75_01934 [bacterium ADurb.Bin425]|nr:MAG: hypothetical protein BWY75_01934 [bacterium ADurb.Bin425]